MNNRHRRVERLRRKYETPAERLSREIMQAFLRFGREAEKAAESIRKTMFH